MSTLDIAKWLLDYLISSPAKPFLDIGIAITFFIILLSIVIRVLLWESNIKLYKIIYKSIPIFRSKFSEAMASPYDNAFPKVNKLALVFQFSLNYTLSVILLIFYLIFGFLMIYAPATIGNSYKIILFAALSFIFLILMRFFKASGDKLLYEYRALNN